jgi:hypothetical protein
MNAGWIFTQNCFHPAHRLDDPRVLQFRELSQTTDRCRDEHQVICFFGMLTQVDVG